MKVLRAIAVTLLVAAVPFTSFADQAKKKDLNAWQDCGIGAMIFENTNWAASISNVIWDLGTTAVISDQSSQDSCKSTKARTALYIGVTYANLSEDLAKGEGKHLQAMLDVAGCESSSHAAIIQSLRTQYGSYLSDARNADKATNAKAEDLYNIVDRTISSSYQGQCRV